MKHGLNVRYYLCRGRLIAKRRFLDCFYFYYYSAPLPADPVYLPERQLDCGLDFARIPEKQMPRRSTSGPAEMQRSSDATGCVSKLPGTRGS